MRTANTIGTDTYVLYLDDGYFIIHVTKAGFYANQISNVVDETMRAGSSGTEYTCKCNHRLTVVAISYSAYSYINILTFGNELCKCQISVHFHQCYDRISSSPNRIRVPKYCTLLVFCTLCSVPVE